MSKKWGNAPDHFAEMDTYQLKLSMSQTKLAVSILFKLGVMVSCWIGINQHDLSLSDGFMDSIFKAFTMQSNIWMAVICLVFLGFDWIQKGNRKIPQWLHAIKFMFTTSALLTWLVFAVLLTPMMNINYLLSPSNLFLHNLTPILALLDFIIFDQDSRISHRHLGLGLIMPLLYAIFFFSAYEITGKLPVPYFFLDYKKLGWVGFGAEGIGVAYWVGLLLLALIGIGAVALKLKVTAERRPLLVSGVVLVGMVSLSIIFSLVSL
jgi:hypothetical protein